MLSNNEIEKNLEKYQTRMKESSSNILGLILDFFSNLLDSYDDFLFSLYLLTFFVIIFGSYMFDPFQISSSVPILFLFTWIITLFLSCFLYGIYKSKDLDFTILPLYAVEFLYGCGYLLIMVAIFFSAYYVIKKMLIHISVTSVIVIVTLVMLFLSLFYSMTKDRTSQETDSSSSFLTFFLNVLFVIPCLFVDFYDVVVKDIKQAPSSTFTLISIISVIIILYYVLPFIQRMKTRDKNAIQLQQSAKELNTMVASITKKELKDQKFDKKSFFNKQILNLNKRIEKSLPDNTEYDRAQFIRKQLEHHKVYTHSNDDESNLSLEFTYLKDISMCSDSETIRCDNNKITCDGVEVKNDIGMFQTCFIDEPNSYFGKLMKKSNHVKHPSYYVDLLKNNEDLMTFYMEPSSNPISFQQFCKITTGGTDPYTIGCVHYDDVSNSIFKNQDASSDFVLNNSDQLEGQSIFVCDTTNKSVTDSDKYHVIHGYNDENKNQEIPFLCKPKTLQKKSTTYSDYRKALNSEYDTYQEGQMVYYDQRVVRIKAIHYSEDKTPPTYDIIYMLPPSTGMGTKQGHEKGDFVQGVQWDELSVIENKGVLSILTSYNEGFASHNPDVHALDKNLNDESLTFTGFTRPEEKKIIENILKNSNFNVEEQVQKMKGNQELEQDLITFLTNNENVSNIMDNLYEMNLGSDSYLSQEVSKLVQMINRANNIYDYNYHFAISFWVYFDPEVLKQDTSTPNGMIMNYANVLNMFYHHMNHSIVVEVHDNQEMKEIYESNTIAFQKWNHFVFNYSYGTLDLFINNHLVMTKKNMTPQYKNIGDNEIILKFGDDDKPLKHCGICNIQYFEIPLKLDQIESLYAKKGNPCK